MLEILRYPDPFLREVSAPVETIDDDLRAFARDMIDCMYAHKGVGLAAPQVGRHLRLVVIDIDPQRGDPRVFINPVITWKSRERESANEGCLSLPGLEGKVARALEVKAEALDLNGELVEYHGTDLFARALQHETDHLDGVLFVDKLSLAGKFALRHELARLEAAFAEAGTDS